MDPRNGERKPTWRPLPFVEAQLERVRTRHHTRKTQQCVDAAQLGHGLRDGLFNALFILRETWQRVPAPRDQRSRVGRPRVRCRMRHVRGAPARQSSRDCHTHPSLECAHQSDCSFPSVKHGTLCGHLPMASPWTAERQAARAAGVRLGGEGDRGRVRGSDLSESTIPRMVRLVSSSLDVDFGAICKAKSRVILE